MPIQTHKFQNIQALRGLAVLLVVFLHLLVIEKKIWSRFTAITTIF